MIEMYWTDKGYEIRKHNKKQRLPSYLTSMYSDGFHWTHDRQSAKHFRSKKVAFQQLKAIQNKYQEPSTQCRCIFCTYNCTIPTKESNGVLWGECPQCGTEYWLAK